MDGLVVRQIFRAENSVAAPIAIIQLALEYADTWPIVESSAHMVKQ